MKKLKLYLSYLPLPVPWLLAHLDEQTASEVHHATQIQAVQSRGEEAHWLYRCTVIWVWEFSQSYKITTSFKGLTDIAPCSAVTYLCLWAKLITSTFITTVEFSKEDALKTQAITLQDRLTRLHMTSCCSMTNFQGPLDLKGHIHVA